MRATIKSCNPRKIPYTGLPWLWTLIVCVGAIIQGCAGWTQPAAPAIEDYLPKSAIAAQATTSVTAPTASDTAVAATCHPAEKPPLTLQDCVRLALAKNPLLHAAEQGVIAARESVGEARAPYYPDLNLAAGYNRFQRHIFLPSGIGLPGATVPTVVGPTNDWSAGLRTGYTLFDSGARRAQFGSATARLGTAEESAASTRQDVVLNVYQRFYTHAAAIETRSVAGKNLTTAENHLRLARERKAAGTVPQADVLRAQVEASNARLALIRASNLVRVTMGELNTIMGLPAETGSTITVQPDEITAPDTIELGQMMDRAIHVRPVLKASLQRVAAAHSSVDSARSSFGPKIRAEGGYGWRDDEFLPHDEEWNAGVFLELPLFTGFSRFHRLSRTKAELGREEADLTQLILSVRQEVWNAYSNFGEAFEAINAAQDEVENAREGERTTRERYEAGAGTINDLLDAQTALARAETSLVRARWDYHVAKAVWLHAVGNLEADGE